VTLVRKSIRESSEKSEIAAESVIRGSMCLRTDLGAPPALAIPDRVEDAAKMRSPDCSSITAESYIRNDASFENSALQ